MSTGTAGEAFAWTFLLLLGPLGGIPLVASVLAWRTRRRSHAALALAACALGVLWGTRWMIGATVEGGNGGAPLRALLLESVSWAFILGAFAWAGAWGWPRSPLRHVGVAAAAAAALLMLGAAASFAAAAAAH